MKTREFTIQTESLDIEYIESLKIYDEYVNIKLSQTRKYFNDDWYVNLQRVS